MSNFLCRIYKNLEKCTSAALRAMGILMKITNFQMTMKDDPTKERRVDLEFRRAHDAIGLRPMKDKLSILFLTMQCNVCRFEKAHGTLTITAEFQ